MDRAYFWLEVAYFTLAFSALWFWVLLTFGVKLLTRLPRFVTRRLHFRWQRLWQNVQGKRYAFNLPYLEYTQLEDARNVRLLTILPGSRTSALFCELETVALDDGPEFIAASYTWSRNRLWPGPGAAIVWSIWATWAIWTLVPPLLIGIFSLVFGLNASEETEPEQTAASGISWLEIALRYTWRTEKQHVIVCNGKSIRVQENLYELLQELRRQQAGNQRYWIDAICINQQDVEERNQQILLMPAIYTAASRVISWLGPCPLILDDPRIMGSVHLTLSDSDLRSSDPISTLRAAARLYLTSRSYFNRVWIVQEALLPTQLDFLIGSHQLSPSELEVAIELNYRSLQLPFSDLLLGLRVPVDGLLTSRKLYRSRQNWTLADHLSSAAGRQATDPRDLVFAGLGLLKDSRSEATQPKTGAIVTYPERYNPSLLDRPDYSAEVRETFVHCGIRLLQEEGLGALSFAYNGPPDDRIAWVYLPSWVPHFTKPTSRSLLLADQKRTYAAGGFSTPQVVITPSELLLVESGAVFLDSIEVVFKTGMNVLDDVLLYNLENGNAEYSSTQESVFTALARTIVADCFAGQRLGARLATQLFVKHLRKRLETAKRKVVDDRRLMQPVERFMPWKFAIVDQLMALPDAEKWSRIATILDEVDNEPVVTHVQLIDRPALSSEDHESSLPVSAESHNEKLDGQTMSQNEHSLTSTIKPDPEPDSNNYYFSGWRPSEIMRYFSPEPDNYEVELRRKLENYAFFKTQGGYFGIGSPHLEANDVVMVLAGARLPYAGRRLNSIKPTPRVKLLGEVYVHGIMDGELVDSNRWQPEVISIR